MTAAGQSRLVRGGFAVALVVLVLIGWGAYQQGTENIAAARWVAHTYDVQRQLALTFSTVQDIAIGARGYIITGKDEFLEPFHNGQAKIPEQVQALRQLTATIPEQQPRIDFLESLIARRIEFSQENITLRQMKGPEAAQAAVSGGEGERLMDQIRKVIGDMEATEATLLKQRTEHLRASNLRMLGVFIATLVLLAGLLLATHFLVRRDAAARDREHQLAQKAREYAENIVDTVRESLLVLDADLRVLSANRSFYQAFQVSPKETEGALLYELGNGQWNISALRSLLEEVLPKNSRVSDFEVEHDFPAIGHRTMLLTARKTFRVGNNTQSILLAIEDITERKRAEEALRRSEKWLSTTLGSIGDAVIATDQNGSVTFLNAVAQELTGWTQEEAQGKSLDLVFDIINQETRQPVENPVKKVFRAGKVVGLADHTVLISKDRREFDIEDSAAPIVTSEGERIGVVLVFRDVTETKKTEEERDRFFNLSRDMICIAGFDGYFKRLNPAWEKTLGFTPGELLSAPYLSFVHPDDQEATSAEAAKLATGLETISFENRYRCKDGSYKWILWSCTPSVGHQLIYAVARDNTERKRAEEVLRESEMRSRLILDTAHDAFVTMNSEGLIMEWNPQAAATFGSAREEVLGRPLGETIVPARYREAHLQGLEHFLAFGEHAILNKRIEMFALHRDGHEIPVELTISAIPLGTSYIFCAFLHDITERKRAEEALLFNQQRLAGMVESAMDAVITVDEAQGIVLFNHAAEEMFRCKASEVLGQPIDRFIPERFRGRHREHVRGFAATGVTSRSMAVLGCVLGRRADGEEFPVEASISQIKVGGARLFTVIL
ncbi:MAG: PAS domain S-box protein, partial [Acidobacteria bacterium]|nr:PAS domain S-box protein [Acidobacteriota bacterium]